MIKTLRESKARLSELVRRAGKGEEVIITVRGKPMAKLGPVTPVYPVESSKEWLQELRALQTEYTTRNRSSDEAWNDLRGDRFS
jgi:prevent-host-death family protein